MERSAEARVSAAMEKHFGTLSDPRMVRKTDHELLDVVVISVLAALCGADGWTDVEEFGKTKHEWLKTFLKLPCGIPAHDTFGRIFALLDAEEFQAAFSQWMQAVFQVTDGDVVPIDGKTVRRSYDTASNKGALHMVSAWTAENGAVLGQTATEEKSNEITAIPELLRKLELTGCIVTIDALGCQREIAADIQDQGADYVLQVKGNQPTLLEEIKTRFDQAVENDFAATPCDVFHTEEKGHGRWEERTYRVLDVPPDFGLQARWPGLRSLAMVVRRRVVGGQESWEVAYYISSLPRNAEQHARAIRGHWSIENSLHWRLDVVFREDDSRLRTGASAENFAVLRHVALNLLKQEQTLKRGLKTKRLKAAMDTDYLLKVLEPAL